MEPISRLKSYLTGQGAWDDEKEQQLLEEAARQVEEEVAAYQAMGKPPVESMFEYMFADMPAELEAQRDRAMEESR
jgi:pyruvate dehydrogenase E1 component alpha subunit